MVGISGHLGKQRARAARRVLPFAVAAAVGPLTVLIGPGERNGPLIGACVLATSAIFLAAVFLPWGRLPRQARPIPALLYFPVVSLLKHASGAGASHVGLLYLLPVFWLALYGTRRQLGLALAALAAALVTPLLLVGPPDYPVTEWRRVVLWLAVGPLVGFTTQRIISSARSRKQQLEMVGELARSLSTGDDTRAGIVTAACKATGGSIAALLEPTVAGNLTATATSGFAGPPPRVPLTGEPSGAARAFASARRYFSENAAADPGIARRLVESTGVRSVVFEPVVRRGESVGVLVVGWPVRGRHVDADAASAVRLLAAEAAVAIERADLLRQVHAMALTDVLTGLPNRRAWDEELARAVQEAKHDGAGFSIGILDFDEFKQFNDTFGHQAGDRLLKATAAAWMPQMRSTDLLARYGGEEFGVILRGCERECAARAVERLRAAMPDRETCSAGVASWVPGEPVEALIARADAALYEAKHAGRDRVQLSAP